MCNIFHNGYAALIWDIDHLKTSQIIWYWLLSVRFVCKCYKGIESFSDDLSALINSTSERDHVNVQLNVANICGELRPSNSGNNELKGINVLQKYTLLHPA